MITGKRPVVWHIVESSATLCGFADNIYNDIRIGSNGKVYFKHANNRIFMGNQYTKTRKVTAFAHANIVGVSLNILDECPQVIYTKNRFGDDSREYHRALAVASGRVIGGQVAGKLAGKGLGVLAGAAAASCSGGTLSGVAFFVGDVVGSYIGGTLGTDFGGTIGGAIFDLTN